MEVTLNSYRGRLRLHFPRRLFGGKNKFLSLELDDTGENRIKARQIIGQANLDIIAGSFDYSLESYKVVKLKPTVISVLNLATQYYESKAKRLKLSTQSNYEQRLRYLERIGDIPYNDSITLMSRLENITTKDKTREVIAFLSSVCTWGVNAKIIEDNPYKFLLEKMPLPNWVKNPNPSPFTREERDFLIDRFISECPHYGSFVEFLFRTGCRPSEAVGLTWGQISDDGLFVTFDRSICLIKGKKKQVDLSKNNRSRKCRLSPLTVQLLNSLERVDNFVFHGVRGGTINYNSFSRHAWEKLVTDRTPYACRDTFITLQLLKGVSAALIAAYCDTSIEIIEKHYASRLMLSSISPSD